MSTPMGGGGGGGGHINFPFSAVRRHTWFPVISRKGIYPIFTKFGIGVYWVDSLHGIAFGEDSSTKSILRKNIYISLPNLV